MRFDVNVSVRPAGSDELRTRTELKNMNSFNFAAKGIEQGGQRGRSRSTSRAARSSRRRSTSTRTTRTRRRSAQRRRRRTTATSRSPTSCRWSRRPGSSRSSASRWVSCRATGSAASPRRSRSTTPTCSSRAGSTGSGRASVAAGADAKETANVLANAFVATGVDPERVSPAELAKLVAARAEIPRDAFDEALAHSGDDGFSADPYVAQKAVSDVGELDPVIDERHRGEPGAGRAVPRRQGGPARLLRRPGDEGDRRQGRSARRQHAGHGKADGLASDAGFMQKRYLFTPGPTPVPPEVLAADGRADGSPPRRRLPRGLRADARAAPGGVPHATARYCSSRRPAPARWSPRSPTSRVRTSRSRSSSPARSASDGRRSQRCTGSNVQRIDYEWGEVPDPAEIASAVREAAPASSSAPSPRPRPASSPTCRRSRPPWGTRRLVVDAVSSLGAVPLDVGRVGDRRRRLRLPEGADVPARPRDGLGRRPPLGRPAAVAHASTSTGARPARRRRSSTPPSRRPCR